MAQYDDYMRDYRDVVEGRKPAVVIEARKSRKAFLRAAQHAADRGVPHSHVKLADSKGQQHRAIIAGREVSNVQGISRLLKTRDLYTREAFQTAMGRLLGYSDEDIQSYLRSPISKRCGCELCGGTTTASSLDDEARVRRTMFYNT